MAWFRGQAVLPPGLTVVVWGPAGSELIRSLWRAGLRPVRGGQPGATVWALPGQAGRP